VKVTGELVDKIREFYSRGYSVRKIASVLNISKQYLYVIMKYYGIIRGRGLGGDVIRSIVSDYLSGMKAREVASKYGVSEGSVRFILKSLGVSRVASRSAVGLSDDVVKLLRDMSRRGVSDVVIGKVLGLSKHQVYRLRRKLGIVKSMPSVMFELTEKLIDLLVKHGVVDSVLFSKVTGRPLSYSIIQGALKRGVEIGYGKITGTSTQRHWVLPAHLCGRYIVYLKERERDALMYLLKQANPRAHLNAIRNRVEGPLKELVPDVDKTVGKYLAMYRSN